MDIPTDLAKPTPEFSQILITLNGQGYIRTQIDVAPKTGLSSQDASRMFASAIRVMAMLAAKSTKRPVIEEQVTAEILAAAKQLVQMLEVELIDGDKGESDTFTFTS